MISKGCVFILKESLLFVDHIVRELESNVLISKYFYEFGGEARIYSINFNYFKSIKDNTPGSIVMPWLYDKNEYEFIKPFNNKSINTPVINLHQEQIGIPSNQGFMLPSDRYSRDVIHICWGKNFAKLLFKNGVPKENIYITGSQRLDLYHERFKSLRKSKLELAQKYDLDVHKKWLLLPGSFGIAFLSESEISSLERRGHSQIKSLKELSFKTLKIISEWIKKISKDLDLEIIFRPHPGVSNNYYNDKFNNYKNIHLISELNIKEWIFNSDIIAVWNSTTAIEGWFANKTVIGYQPIPLTKELKLDFMEGISYAKNYKDFKNLITKGINDQLDLNSNFKNKFIENWYYKNDGLASFRIADIIYRNTLNNNKSISSTSMGFKEYKGLFKQKIKKLLVKNKLLEKMKSYKGQSVNYFNNKNINKIREEFKEIDFQEIYCNHKNHIIKTNVGYEVISKKRE